MHTLVQSYNAFLTNYCIDQKHFDQKAVETVLSLMYARSYATGIVAYLRLINGLQWRQPSVTVALQSAGQTQHTATELTHYLLNLQIEESASII